MLKFPVSLLTRTNVGEFLDKIVFRINYKWEEVICILLFIRCGREKFSLGCRVAIVRSYVAGYLARYIVGDGCAISCL